MFLELIVVFCITIFENDQKMITLMILDYKRNRNMSNCLKHNSLKKKIFFCENNL